MVSKFWKNKKVIITGNTGFKGSWFSLVLILSGAKVYGFSDKKNDNNIFFKTLNLNSLYKTSYGDISDFASFNKFSICAPDIPFVISIKFDTSTSFSYGFPFI